MARSFAWALAVSCGAVGACSTQEPSGSRTLPGPGPYTVTPEVELAVGSQPGLVSWHQDVVVLCPPAEVAGPRDNCEVHALDVAGNAKRTGIRGARTARRTKSGILVQRPNRDLVLIADDGSEQKLADDATTPGVSEDGKQVAYLQRAPTGTRIVLHDLAANVLVRIVTTDPTAYAPYIVPGTSDVLFASARTGVVSYFVGSADGQEKQLTNVGMTQIGKGFVPVAMEQLLWLPGTQTAVFTAHYERDDIWKLDVSGKATKLGPGALPNLKTGGGIVALDRPPPHVERAPHVAQYQEAP